MLCPIKSKRWVVATKKAFFLHRIHWNEAPTPGSFSVCSSRWILARYLFTLPCVSIDNAWKQIFSRTHSQRWLSRKLSLKPFIHNFFHGHIRTIASLDRFARQNNKLQTRQASTFFLWCWGWKNGCSIWVLARRSIARAFLNRFWKIVCGRRFASTAIFDLCNRCPANNNIFLLRQTSDVRAKETFEDVLWLLIQVFWPP